MNRTRKNTIEQSDNALFLLLSIVHDACAASIGMATFTFFCFLQ